MRKYFAVLFVFLLVVGTVSGSYITPTPLSEIRALLETAINQPGVLKTTNEGFVRDGTTVWIESITTRSGISSEQVCLSLGQFKGNSDWDEPVPGQTIIYVGKTSKATKFNVLCQNGLDLATTVQSIGTGKISLSDLQDCNCINENKLCCIAVLAESKPGSYSRPLNFLDFVFWLTVFSGLAVVVLYLVGLFFLFSSKIVLLLKGMYLTKILLFIIGFLISGFIGSIVAFFPQVFLSTLGCYLISRTREKRASKGTILILVADLIAIAGFIFLLPLALQTP